MGIIQLLAGVLVLAAIVWRQLDSASESPIEIPEQTNSAVLGTLPTPSEAPSPNPSQTPSVALTPTQEPVPQSKRVGEILPHYPNASIISQRDHYLEMISSDAAVDVTAWYERFIDNNGFTARSKVKTTTNGIVNNVIVGAKKSAEIKIEITKTEDQSTVRIKITRTTY